jgi:hypothetical protein
MIAAAPTFAQTPRLQIQPQIMIQPQIDPVPGYKLQQRPPRQQRLKQQQIKPKLMLIPPSQAAQIAIMQNPGATLLNIKPRGDFYVATMRQGNQVFRVRIPGY